MAISFKGAHFPPDISLKGVRWYVVYPLSTRHVEERRLPELSLPGRRRQETPRPPTLMPYFTIR